MTLPDHARPDAIELLTQAHLNFDRSAYARRLVANAPHDFHPCEVRQARAQAIALIEVMLTVGTEERRIAQAIADGEPIDLDDNS